MTADTELVDGLMTLMRRGAEDVGSTFTKADDDWSQLAFIIPADFTGLPPIAAMINFADDEEKLRVLHRLAEMARTSSATALGLVLNTWVSIRPTVEGVRPSQDPNRIERLTLVAMTRTQERFSFADIVRDLSDPPRLDWEVDPLPEGATFDGLFSDILRPALRPQG